jgi:hypothetical protein
MAREVGRPTWRGGALDRRGKEERGKRGAGPMGWLRGEWARWPMGRWREKELKFEF